MYAISMARNIDHQIENKRTATIDITKACGTIWDLKTAFGHMRDFSLPGREHYDDLVTITFIIIMLV